MYFRDQKHAGLCLGRRRYTSPRKGRSQGTTLSGSNRYNARVTIVNPFYNMECKMIKKLGHDKTWIHSMHKYNSQSVQCSRPSHRLRRQWRHNPIQLRDVRIVAQRTLLCAHVNGTEIVLKSTDQRLNISFFLHEQGLNDICLTVLISKIIRWNCFSKMWRILLPRTLKNNDLQC